MSYGWKQRRSEGVLTWCVVVYLTKAEQTAWGSDRVIRSTGEQDRAKAEAVAEAVLIPRIRREIAAAVAAGSRELAKKARPPMARPTVLDPEALKEAATGLREDVRTGRVSQDQAIEHLGVAHDLVLEGRSDIDPETGQPIDADGRLQTASDRAWQLLTDPDYRPIAEWITLHLEAKAAAGMAPPTVISRRKALEQFAGWLGSSDDVRKVGRRQAVRYIDERITPLAREHSTKLAEVMHLSAFFGWVRDRAPLESNPFHALTKQIPKPARGEDPKRRAWLPAELKALLSAEFPHPIMSAAVLLGLYTGARINELCSMLISRVNLTDEGTPENPFPESMRLTPKRLKNNESMRSIPIHPIIRPLVAKLVETSWDGFLLSGLDEAGTSGKRSTHLSDDFGKWRRYVGVGAESTPFHALRHTFATALEDAEVYSVTASRLVGHSPVGMTFGTYSEGRWEKRAADMHRVSYGDVDNLAARLVAEHPGNPPKGTVQIRSFLPASKQRGMSRQTGA